MCYIERTCGFVCASACAVAFVRALARACVRTGACARDVLQFERARISEYDTYIKTIVYKLRREASHQQVLIASRKPYITELYKLLNKRTAPTSTRDAIQ